MVGIKQLGVLVDKCTPSRTISSTDTFYTGTSTSEGTEEEVSPTAEAGDNGAQINVCPSTPKNISFSQHLRKKCRKDKQ